jgi:FkbM family methyltransferase
MNRFDSIVKSIRRNGFLKTLTILFQIGMLKLGLRSCMRFQGRKYYLRKSSSDLPVFRQIFMDGDYDIHVGFTPKVIVDLGANIGLASLYFHERFPDARIIALEPDKGNFKQFITNVSHYVNIKPLNLAIWSESKSLHLVQNKNFGEWGMQVSSNKVENSNEMVDAISIPKLMELEGVTGIDILKIDIEGAEYELFKDASWLVNVRVIIIELHDAMVPSSSNTFLAEVSKLERFDFGAKGENIIVYNRSFQTHV